MKLSIARGNDWLLKQQHADGYWANPELPALTALALTSLVRDPALDLKQPFPEAIQKGFDEARAILGGSLPEISEQTHAAIMAELDRWAKDGIPEGEVSLARQTAEGASESG